jgi:hypothetical protein
MKMLEEIESCLIELHDIHTPEIAIGELVFPCAQPACEPANAVANARQLGRFLFADKPIEHAQKEFEAGFQFHPSLLETLNTMSVSEALDSGRFTHAAVACEEVSHYLYTIWNVSNGRQVTRLEMEIQAEVDTFMTLLFRHVQPGGVLSNSSISALHHFLFDTPKISDGAHPRYHSAYGFGAKACKRIISEGNKRNLDAMLRASREFFRKRLQDKVRYAMA